MSRDQIILAAGVIPANSATYPSANGALPAGTKGIQVYLVGTLGGPVPPVMATVQFGSQGQGPGVGLPTIFAPWYQVGVPPSNLGPLGDHLAFGVKTPATLSPLAPAGAAVCWDVNWQVPQAQPQARCDAIRAGVAPAELETSWPGSPQGAEPILIGLTGSNTYTLIAGIANQSIRLRRATLFFSATGAGSARLAAGAVTPGYLAPVSVSPYVFDWTGSGREGRPEGLVLPQGAALQLITTTIATLSIIGEITFDQF